MVGPEVVEPSLPDHSWARGKPGRTTQSANPKAQTSAHPKRARPSSMTNRTVRRELDLRNYHRITAFFGVWMQRSVTRDIEHRADVVERLLVEPAFAPRATHRVAIGSRLARP